MIEHHLGLVTIFSKRNLLLCLSACGISLCCAKAQADSAAQAVAVEKPAALCSASSGAVKCADHAAASGGSTDFYGFVPAVFLFLVLFAGFLGRRQPANLDFLRFKIRSGLSPPKFPRI